MGKLREEIEIKAPPARVWRIIEKHMEHPELSTEDQGSREIQAIRGEPLSEQDLALAREPVGTTNIAASRLSGTT